MEHIIYVLLVTSIFGQDSCPQHSSEDLDYLKVHRQNGNHPFCCGNSLGAPCIPNLSRIHLAITEICVFEVCLIFFAFFF